jgi:hypothetical protein
MPVAAVVPTRIDVDHAISSSYGQSGAARGCSAEAQSSLPYGVEVSNGNLLGQLRS